MGYRALVEYDGTAYCGFQRQRREPTIQAQLEKAILEVTDRHVRVIGAGRTDSGVHATGQVIAFNVDWRHDQDALERALNANLPADIAVRQLEVAPESFHPRFDASGRVYEYQIFNGPIRSPLNRLRSWHVAQPLDVAEMNRAAETVVGQHDFATFGQPPQGDSTERVVYKAIWRREDELVILEIEANAYLYRMVRSLVGSMKAVGEGRWTARDFTDVLAARDRSLAAQTAPPQGLCLVSVTY